MKIKLVVKKEDSEEKGWNEYYDTEVDNLPIDVNPDPIIFGKQLINWFNQTLRPTESRRELVTASLLDE